MPDYDLSPLTPEEQEERSERRRRMMEQLRGVVPELQRRVKTMAKGESNEGGGTGEVLVELRNIRAELRAIGEAIRGLAPDRVTATGEATKVTVAPVAALPEEGVREKKTRKKKDPVPEPGAVPPAELVVPPKAKEPEKKPATVVEARAAVLAHAQKFTPPVTLAKMQELAGVKAVADIKDPALYQKLVDGLKLEG